MLTGEIRNKVDKLWEAFWTGGIANPLTVIEQISYLLFIKRLDDMNMRQATRSSSTEGDSETRTHSLTPPASAGPTTSTAGSADNSFFATARTSSKLTASI